MIKAYLINQPTRLSAWLAFSTIFAALFLPKSVVITLMVIVILTPDNKLQSLIEKWSPWVKANLEKF